jgi:hypothetical protein
VEASGAVVICPGVPSQQADDMETARLTPGDGVGDLAHAAGWRPSWPGVPLSTYGAYPAPAQVFYREELAFWFLTCTSFTTCFT